MAKGLSPLISVTILIVIAITTASFVATWIYGLTVSTTNQTQSDAQRLLMCRSAGLDFDYSYGYHGIDYSFEQNVSDGDYDWISAKVENTGNVDLYGFVFEAVILNGTTEDIVYFDPTPQTQKSPGNPLRPARSAIITANITYDINVSAVTLTEVTIISTVCPEVSPSADM